MIVNLKSAALSGALKDSAQWHLAVFPHADLLRTEWGRIADDMPALKKLKIRVSLSNNQVVFAGGGLKLVVVATTYPHMYNDMERFRGWRFASLYAPDHPKAQEIRNLLVANCRLRSN